VDGSGRLGPGALARLVNAVTNGPMPDLVVGLIKVRDAIARAADQGAGIVPWVAELTATVHNRGDALADETTTRFWLRGADVDRELRVIYTPPLPAGEEIEVTALWDVRGRRGEYVITVTADAFSQVVEVREDNNSASIRVAVKDNRVDPV
jgi:subtilase family serine protease